MTTNTFTTRLRPVLLGVLGVLAFLALWEAASRLAWVNPTYVPPASETLAALGRFAVDRYFWGVVGDTMITWSIGMLIATTAAVVLGTIIGLSPFLRRYTRTTIEFLRPIPSVAIIPIAVVLFGVTREASLVIVVFATFWQILIQVLYGVADIDPVARDTQYSFGISANRRFLFLVLPTALPYLMTGIRLGATVAMILTVTGELLIGARGIGWLLLQRSSAGDYAGVYALVLTAGVLALILNLIIRVIERRLLAWHQSVRGEVLV